MRLSVSLSLPLSVFCVCVGLYISLPPSVCDYLCLSLCVCVCVSVCVCEGREQLLQFAVFRY